MFFKRLLRVFKGILSQFKKGGGAITILFRKFAIAQGTESPIDLKPGCTFKFVHCDEEYSPTVTEIKKHNNLHAVQKTAPAIIVNTTTPTGNEIKKHDSEEQSIC